MNSSELNDFLNEHTSGQVMAGKISMETEQYEQLLKKKGSTIPLILNEDESIVIDKDSLRILFTAVQQGHLSNVQLAYICDCLSLAEEVSYENEFIREAVLDLADPEINGGFSSAEQISGLLKTL